MGRRSRNSQEEVGQDATNSQQESSAPTFKEAKGSEPNQHAKTLAKKEAEKKAKQEIFKYFYTVAGHKVLKMICKANGVYSVYIGSLKKNADVLKGSIEKWKKEGIFCEGHAAKEKAKELRADAMKELNKK